MNLATWAEEDLRGALVLIAEMRKGISVQWNEALHPRDSNGQFAVAGTHVGRALIEGLVHAMHDGMTQRSKATHLKIYHALHQNPETNAHAQHYWKAVKKAQLAKQLIHPKEAYGKAIMAIHTGDQSHLEAGPPKVKPTSTVSAPAKPKFITVKKFLHDHEGARSRIRDAAKPVLNAMKAVNVAAIRKYTGDWYGTINPHLREGVLPGNQRKTVEELDEALRDTTTTENIVVGRNISSSALNKIQKAGVGGIFQDPGYVSTKMSPYENQHAIIEIPKGSPGLYVDSISKHPGEDEFLLPRESEFEILSVGDYQSKVRLRYIGSSKAAHRPDVEASLTVTQEEVKQPVVMTPAIAAMQTSPPPKQVAPTNPAIFDFAQASFGWKKIDGPHGSQPGQWYKDDKYGWTYYVKPMSEARAANEVGAQRAYRTLGGAVPGVDVPITWMAQDKSTGQVYVISQKIDNLSTAEGGEWAMAAKNNTHIVQDAKKLWAMDVLLSNWDAVGLAHDNLVINPNKPGGGVARIDAGGAMQFRAQGALKETWKTGIDNWVEPWTMRGLGDPYGKGKPGSQAKNIFGHMTNTEAANSLMEIHNRIGSKQLAELQSTWKAMGMNDNDIVVNLQVISGRLQSIPAVVEKLNQHPTMKALAA